MQELGRNNELHVAKQKNHASEDCTQAQPEPADHNGSMLWVGHDSPEQGREAQGGEIMMGDVEIMRNGLRMPELAWRMLERQDQTGCKG